MNNQQLDRANALSEEISELESFIFSSERVWTGRIIKKDTKYIFRSNGYGWITSKEFIMNTTIKNKVLNVLKEYLEELKEELKSL